MIGKSRMKRALFAMYGLFAASSELLGMEINPRSTHIRACSSTYIQVSSTQPQMRNRTFSARTNDQLEEFYTKRKEEEKILKKQRENITKNTDQHRQRIEELQNKNQKNERKSFVLGNSDIYTAYYLYYKEISNGEASGKVQISHKYGAVRISGWYCNNFLYLNYPVEVRVANDNQSYVFEMFNATEYQLLLPVDLITKISKAIPCGSFACLKFEEGNKGFIVTSESFYIGDINNDQATGKGIMVESTGRILCGIFDYGVLMEATDDMKEWFQEIFYLQRSD